MAAPTTSRFWECIFIMKKKCCIMNDNIMQLILVQFFFLDELVNDINNREQTRQS